MKEIWKLIELLNERKWSKLYYAANWSIRMVWEFPISELEIISKKFWFIKWLVENDKIDLWKIKKLYRKSNENSTHTYPILYDYSYDESLLMFLAIQDEPIRFLCEILK
jgi:hypothetical protein